MATTDMSALTCTHKIQYKFPAHRDKQLVIATILGTFKKAYNSRLDIGMTGLRPKPCCRTAKGTRLQVQAPRLGLGVPVVQKGR